MIYCVIFIINDRRTIWIRKRLWHGLSDYHVSEQDQGNKKD